MDSEVHQTERVNLQRKSRAPAGFARYRSRAAVLARSSDELTRLAGQAARKLVGPMASGRLRSVRSELGLFVALLQAYASGSYRQVSNATLVSVAAAVLYFVVPLDLVPDFIFGLGLLDDIAVIGFVLERVRGELAAFERWQSDQGAGSEPEPQR